MQVTCPLCGEFDGSTSEVQAHISSKKDVDHSGQVGDDVLKDPEKAMEVQGEKTERPGKETQGTALDVPKLACKGCGRKVKYPELMPFKMTCPECGREMRKRGAAEKMEEKADEKGKDETVETVEA
jgi:predicted RNA-binding Zn-ribbon protein involved in translation (DUF1610 family)